jgi:hypothetical protein
MGHSPFPFSFVLVALLMAGSGIGAVPVAAAPPEAPPAGLSTPQLIERAVQRGEVSRARGDLYLAFALADHRRLPERFQSDVPWRGTLPLLHLRERLTKAPPSTERDQAREVLAAPTTCSNNVGNLSNVATTEHFYVQYGTIGAGLTIGDYTTSLETAWTKEVTTFGWAAPPLKDTPGTPNRYHVAIKTLTGGLYGFVSPSGTYAGFVGNNPNTSWNDIDAYASCMVLNKDYTGFPSPPQESLNATTAHEFNHSIQFGIGAITGTNSPDAAFIEGGATWMEDEVFDDADDNHNYLWPPFTSSLGQFSTAGIDEYAAWVIFRGLTEPFGTGVAGGGEDVMQSFWEQTSQSTSSNMLTSLNQALVAEESTLAEAYHAAAIALKFNKACSGGYVYPYCLEEGPAYVAAQGPTTVHKVIAAVGGSTTGTTQLQDNYALNWVQLPAAGGAYSIQLSNTSAGGQLRGSVVCDTGSALSITPLPAVVGAGGSTSLASFDPAGCTSVVLVITNESQTSPNPSSSLARAYVVTTTSATANETLTLTKDGTGAGTVTSSPAGINCGSTCSSSFAQGTLVTLTATPSGGSTFTGWSGSGCSGTGACQVTMDEAKAVTATFTLNTYELAVIADGNGSVESVPAGIACPADCSETYNHGTSVTLTPSPDSGWTFGGWSGACTGTAACVVAMTEAKSVTATFLQLFTVNVSKAGAGSGTVSIEPGGIGCDLPCSPEFPDGTEVVLTATPDPSSLVTSWSGCDSDEGDECTVVVNGTEDITVTFATGFVVDVEVTGGGTVDAGSFSCDSVCSEVFESDTTVRFTATPDPGGVFIGWSGDVDECDADLEWCDIVIDDTKSIVAAFDDPPGAPAITVVRPFVRKKPFPISWSATGADTYDLSVRAAKYDGAFGAFQDLLSGTLDESFSFGQGKNGRTYCFTVKAYDASGPPSQGEECTAVPANDRALSATSSWDRRTGTGYYRGTFSVSRSKGARLSLPNVQAEQLAIIATKCSRCGKVKVYFAGALLRTIDLRASTTRKNRLIFVDDFGELEVGNVKIVVASSGKPVRIEGLGVYRDT